jgi:hypothetical protein
MPQMQLPVFPAGLTAINQNIGFQCESGRVVYFHGHLPVFEHDVDDVQSFRLYTSQLIESGAVKQGEIVQSFGVPLITVKRYTKVLREKGSKGFFVPRKTRSSPVLTEDVQQRCQDLLEEGRSVPEVARETNVLANTLHKAIRAGRLKKRN